MKILRWSLASSICIFFIACSGSPSTGESSSSGQATGARTYSVSYYAASRFAEQASMGPSPELIDGIRSKGFEAWIDDQFALQPTQLPLVPDAYRAPGGADKPFVRGQFLNQAISSQAQLRVKTVWSLSQFLVTSQGKISGAASLGWINMLLANAFTDYGTLLQAVSMNPAMGWYLDNTWNRPKSAQCPWCEPNENFARELMELFSVGTTLINSDGSSKRDANGDKINTYSQRDVENMARALTGWQPIRSTKEVWGDSNDWTKPMEVSPDAFQHDWGSKTLLGKQIPAGQTAEQDLKSVIRILVGHENTAPFIATRLIQHFVKSNPSPAYILRVSKVFTDNGKGQIGDLRAVIKAVLLDPEARQGDDPSRQSPSDGKYKEPLLYQTQIWRGLACRAFPSNASGLANFFGDQVPFMPETVFSFYSPHGIASGSDLPAPEQKLVNAQEFQRRMTMVGSFDWSPVLANNSDSTLLSLQNSGCEIDVLNQIYAKSIDEYLNYLSMRYFRGTMPESLRQEIKTINTMITGYEWVSTRRALHLLQYALVSPYFGIIK